MLLKDFIKASWVEGLTKDSLELVPASFIDSVDENRESDIIYKVKLQENEVFVFVLLEHQSKVNYLMTFRVLEYMVKLWRTYIDEHKKKSVNKSFLLPPIYPIIFYDGDHTWTAVENFADKIKDKDLFLDFIPNFKYDIINLKEISYEELQTYEDLLSTLMIIDKIKKPSDFENIRKIKKEYWERLKTNVNTRRELEKIAEAISLLLQRINVPQEDIDELIENIYDGRLDKMFEMSVHYDWQETRKLALEEGVQKGLQEGMQQGKLEIIINMLKNQLDDETISKFSGISIEEIREIKKQLKNN